MSKEEVKDMRTYVYHNQILCRPSIQAHVLSEFLPPPPTAVGSDAAAVGSDTAAEGSDASISQANCGGDLEADGARESASKKAKVDVE